MPTRYDCHLVTMDAQDYGVPHARERVMVVGIRKDERGIFKAPPSFPEWRRNLGDALRDLMGANGWTRADAWADGLRDRLVIDDGMPREGAVAPTLTRVKKNALPNQREQWARLHDDVASMPYTAPTDRHAELAGSKQDRAISIEFGRKATSR